MGGGLAGSGKGIAAKHSGSSATEKAKHMSLHCLRHFDRNSLNFSSKSHGLSGQAGATRILLVFFLLVVRCRRLGIVFSGHPFSPAAVPDPMTRCPLTLRALTGAPMRRIPVVLALSAARLPFRPQHCSQHCSQRRGLRVRCKKCNMALHAGE